MSVASPACSAETVLDRRAVLPEHGVCQARGADVSGWASPRPLPPGTKHVALLCIYSWGKLRHQGGR